MAGAVDRVAGGATEGVVVARQVEVVLPLVGAMAVDVVSVEVGNDAGGGGFGQVADAVIRHGDGRGDTIVVVFGARQIARVVVGVVGGDTPCPNAAGKLAVGGVRVRRALAIGVDLVRHASRQLVIMPGRDITSRRGRSPRPTVRLVAVGGHRDLIAALTGIFS